MGENPFLRYLQTHREADADVLKELFRVLAKRTHPDLGARDAEDFVRLQEYYHAALAHLVQRGERNGPSSGMPSGSMGPRDPGDPFPSPRDGVLSQLYRYKSLLPSLYLSPRELPPACRHAFSDALRLSEEYDEGARLALSAYHEQFHLLRAQNARFPDVRTKYVSLMRGIAGFFDHAMMPNRFNLRVTISYLEEVKAVTDVDPTASPHMRHNRSAAARSALYRMRSWLEDELEKPGFTLR